MRDICSTSSNTTKTPVRDPPPIPHAPRPLSTCRPQTSSWARAEADGVPPPARGDHGRLLPRADPRATWRMSFGLAVACAVLAAVIIPFDRFIDVSKVDNTSPIQGIVTVIDAIFFVDIVLKFNTAIFDKKRDQWCLDE